MADELERRPAPGELTASRWFGGIGGGLAAVGVLAAVVLWSTMAGDDDYTSVDRRLAVLAGLTLAGIGMTVAAIGAVLAKLGD